MARLAVLGIILLFTAMALFLHVPGAFAEGDDGAWQITDDIIFINETKEVDNDIHIRSGGHLTLMNSTWYLGSAEDSTVNITVDEGGSLSLLNTTLYTKYYTCSYSIRVNGTVLISGSSLFNEWNLISGWDGDGQWPEVYLEDSEFTSTNKGTVLRMDNSAISIRNCSFNDFGSQALLIQQSNGSVTGSTFTNVKEAVILLDCSNLDLIDCTFSYCTLPIYGGFLTDCRLSGLSLNSNGELPMEVVQSENVKFDNIFISSGNGEGLVIQNSSKMIISGSRFQNIYGNGVYLSHITDINVEDCRFEGNDLNGLNAVHISELDLQSCIFKSNDDSGLRISDSINITIGNSTFSNNFLDGLTIVNTSKYDINNCGSDNNFNLGMNIVYTWTGSIKECSLQNDVGGGLYVSGTYFAQFRDLTIISDADALSITGSYMLDIYDIDLLGFYDELLYDIYGEEHAGLTWRSGSTCNVWNVSISNFFSGAYFGSCSSMGIKDLALWNVSKGIELSDCEDCSIENCDIEISVPDSEDSILRNLPKTEPSETYWAVAILDGNYNQVRDTRISVYKNLTFGRGFGIYHKGDYSILINLSISGCYYGIYNSDLANSYEVYQVDFDYCVNGIFDRNNKASYSHCRFTNCFYGLVLASTDLGDEEHSMIKNNLIMDCYIGINILRDMGPRSNIISNTFDGNNLAVALREEVSAKIEMNDFFDNGYGIFFDTSYRYKKSYYSYDAVSEVDYEMGDNYPIPKGYELVPIETDDYVGRYMYVPAVVKNNNFIRTEVPPPFKYNNHDDNFDMNFWDDYAGKDVNNDGFGDTEVPFHKCDHNPRVLPYDLSDSDSDGWNDLTEELSGTDPQNASSVPVDADMDGIPDNIRRDPSSSDPPQGDDDDTSSQGALLPPTFRIMALVIVAGFIMVVVFIYYRRSVDSKPVRPVKRKKRRS